MPSVNVNNIEIAHISEPFNKWHFYNSDRIMRDGNSELRKGQSDNFSKRYIYLTTAEILKKRLKFSGFSREGLEREFQEIMVEEMGRYKRIFEKIPENPSEDFFYLQKKIPEIINSKLDQWLDALKIIFQNSLCRNNLRNIKPHVKEIFDNPLVDYYLNGCSFDPEDFDLCLPFKNSSSLAFALTEILPANTEFILDVTDLIIGGEFIHFEDLIDKNRGHTGLFEIFEKSILDVQSLMIVSPCNQILTNLLYANVITTMEVYLYDNLKKNVTNRPVVKRLFVQNSGFFEGKFPIKDIFARWDSLDKKVLNIVDSINFHNLDKIVGLYKSVLDISFPDEIMHNLKQAISKRHDIIHRNGKNVKGDYLEISVDEINELIEVVKFVIQFIDKQIINFLLEDER